MSLVMNLRSTEPAAPRSRVQPKHPAFTGDVLLSERVPQAARVIAVYACELRHDPSVRATLSNLRRLASVQHVGHVCVVIAVHPLYRRHFDATAFSKCVSGAVGQCSADLALDGLGAQASIARWAIGAAHILDVGHRFGLCMLADDSSVFGDGLEYAVRDLCAGAPGIGCAMLAGPGAIPVLPVLSRQQLPKWLKAIRPLASPGAALAYNGGLLRTCIGQGVLAKNASVLRESFGVAMRGMDGGEGLGLSDTVLADWRSYNDAPPARPAARDGPTLVSLVYSSSPDADNALGSFASVIAREGPHPDVQHVVVINGRRPPAAIMQAVQRMPQTRIIHRANVGFDYGGHGHALATETRQHAFYVFLNTSCNGPWISAANRARLAGRPWVRLLTDHLSDKVKLVSCSPVTVGGGAIGEGYAWATDAVGLKVLRETGTIFVQHRTFRACVRNGERPASRVLLAKGYKLGFTGRRYEGFDLNSPIMSPVAERARDWAPSRPGCNYGGSQVPEDVIFAKVNTAMRRQMYSRKHAGALGH